MKPSTKTRSIGGKRVHPTGRCVRSSVDSDEDIQIQIPIQILIEPDPADSASYRRSDGQVRSNPDADTFCL